MKTFDVYLTGYFSDTVTVEIDTDDEFLDENEIAEQAIAEFEQNWLPYSSNGSYTHVWDSVNLDMVEEID